MSGLPTAVNASPPIRQIPPTTEEPSDPLRAEQPTQTQSDPESPPVDRTQATAPIERLLGFEQPAALDAFSAPPSRREEREEVLQEQQPIGGWTSAVGGVGDSIVNQPGANDSVADDAFDDVDEPITGDPAARGRQARLPREAQQRKSFAERARTMASQAGGLIQSILPERSSVQYSSPEDSGTAQTQIEPQQSSAIPASPSVRSHAAEVLAEPLAKMQTFQPPKPTSGRRARLFITAAVLLAVLVPVIVFSVVWQRGASIRAEANMLVEAAKASAQSASAALDLGDKTSARTELTKAQETLREATALIGNRPEITQLAVQIEKELQSVLQVVPLYKLVEPLIRFPPDASPHRVMVVDQDIYVLDQGRNLIQRYRLDASLAALADSDGEAVLRLGDVIDGVSVGPLIDISWQPPVPGVQDKANLLVLDSNNNVFKYNQRVEGAAVLTLGGRTRWQNPLRLQTYLGRLYVADGASGQIFRYNPGQYEAEPDDWMNSPIPQGLSGLQSMFIDGNIWIMLSNGRVLKYSQGVQEPFALDSDVGMVTEPVDMFIGRTRCCADLFSRCWR